MHEKGAGGGVDLTYAMKWYSAAAEQGDLRAHERFAALTVETAVSSTPPADLEPIDEQTEKELAAAAAAGLDDLERVDEAAGAPSDDVAKVEPEPEMETAPETKAESEAEASTMVEATSENVETAPEAEPEAETVSVVVTTGTGIAKRVDRLENSEAVESEAPIIEFDWFGGDDETPSEEDVAVQEVETLPEPVVTIEPASETTRTTVAKQVETSIQGESVPSEAPIIEFNWFGGNDENESGRASPEQDEEQVAIQEVEDAIIEDSVTPESVPEVKVREATQPPAATDEAAATDQSVSGNQQAVSALEVDIPENSPSVRAVFVPLLTGREADPPVPSAEYDLFQPSMESRSRSEDDSFAGP